MARPLLTDVPGIGAATAKALKKAGIRGVAALAKMEQRIFAETDIPVPLTVHVLDHEMVNAFALPGGHIVFFRGLIDEAESPEEIAAVILYLLSAESGWIKGQDITIDGGMSALGTSVQLGL